MARLPQGTQAQVKDGRRSMDVMEVRGMPIPLTPNPRRDSFSDPRLWPSTSHQITRSAGGWTSHGGTAMSDRFCWHRPLPR